MINVPEGFLTGRAALKFDEIEYGVGGIKLLRPADLEKGQIGYAVTSDGRKLVGDGPGEWRADWIVIGSELACGDPLFLSTEAPHKVFTAMDEDGSWDPKLVAPSVEAFWKCVNLFRKIARGRVNPEQLEANPPGNEEIDLYLQELYPLCEGDDDAIDFWAVQAEVDVDER